MLQYGVLALLYKQVVHSYMVHSIIAFIGRYFIIQGK